MDLHIIKLKNGEELLCRKYYTFTNNDEYRLEVLTSSTGETNFEYDVLKEEIESIATYSNCYIKSVPDDIYTATNNTQIITTILKYAEE